MADQIRTTDDRVVVTGGAAGRGTTFVAWLALILAVLALWLAWTAYDRTGGDLDERIRQEVQQGAQNVEESLDAGPDGVDEDDTDLPTNTTQP